MRKLSLTRESLRQIQGSALDQVAGGLILPISYAVGFNCEYGDTLSCDQICPHTKNNTCRDCALN